MLAAVRLAAVKLSPGDLIDQKYRIVRMLGTGGMGSVYEAENIRVDRRVAIKVMHKVRDQQDIARFEREARAAQIGSPHIVQVFDLGYLADGAPYMVMEYLAGETLGERLQRLRRMQLAEFLPIARQILEALGAAHRAGIIHRDLKPDNVFLAQVEGSAEEVVKLLDFGISKFADAARRAADVSLTRSGVAVGTPQYMSPEQVQGSKELDTRTDLYSLGVIFYRCLSGELPFQSEDVAPLLVQILLEEPKALHEVSPEIDAGLSSLVARSMARRADDRFQTAAEFRTALVEWETTHPRAVAVPLPAVQPSEASESNANRFGTNASWSSTAARLQQPKRTLRTIALAVLFSLTGLGGLLVAYQLWTRGRPLLAPATATSSVPDQALSAAALGPSKAPPGVALPPSSNLSARATPSAQARGLVRQSSLQPPPFAAPSADSSVSAASGNTPQIPVKATVTSQEEEDNRHMSRGVR
jgi:serine/threonine protein kinase